MLFSFDECVSVLFSGLAQALESRGEAIRELNLAEQISAISYDVLPWDPYVGIAFRVKSEIETEFSAYPGDWKHSHFIDFARDFPHLGKAQDFVHEAYKSVWQDPLDARERAHVILIAAATALLDHRIASFLQSLGVRTAIVGDQFPWPWFEYIVADDDRSLNINYCALLHANRINRRLGIVNL